ncbi:unnamed protein product, partial [Protopolystoma xenopodis]
EFPSLPVGHDFNASGKRHSTVASVTASSTNTEGGRVVIRPVNVSVRKVAEFLGGYAFLQLRAPNKRQDLDEASFYKLTSGLTTTEGIFS